MQTDNIISIKGDSRTFTDQIGHNITIPFPPQRIISVVPSQTELLFDLELNAEVVGITKFCVHPAHKFSSTAKIGGTKTLNISKIRQLKPDVIIANKEENTKDQIELLMQEFPVWVSDIHDLKGSLDMISRVGLMVNRQPQAKRLIEEIDSSFKSPAFHSPNTFRVAYFIWKDPFMVAGNDTFINSMFTMAGWQNVFTMSRYPEISAKDLILADPDVIFLSSEPYPFKEKHIEEFQLLCPAARIMVVDGELFSWYGSRLKYTASYLRQLQVHVNQ